MEEAAARTSAYDVIVVGSGPAGISAAINVANRQRTVALMGGQTPFGRLRKAHVVANYPGFGSVSGEELAEAFARHLSEFQVPVIEEKASKIIPAEDGFVVFTEREFYEARALVLATGVYREAGIDGEEDLVGQGVSYCVTCDGRLFRGRRAAFISYAAGGEDEASVLAEDYGVEVTFVPLYKGDHRLPDGVRVLPKRDPRAWRGGMATCSCRCRTRSSRSTRCSSTKRASPPRALLEGLASDGRHVTVDRHMETGIPGVFAAGDCTGEPYQTAKAVGEGQVAALQAVRFLRERTKAASGDTA